MHAVLLLGALLAPALALRLALQGVGCPSNRYSQRLGQASPCPATWACWPSRDVVRAGSSPELEDLYTMFNVQWSQWLFWFKWSFWSPRSIAERWSIEPEFILVSRCWITSLPLTAALGTSDAGKILSSTRWDMFHQKRYFREKKLPFIKHVMSIMFDGPMCQH